MEAARAFEKYLRARIRAERLNYSVFEQYVSRRQHKSFDRLRAGHFATSRNSLPTSYIKIPMCRSMADNRRPVPCPEKPSKETVSSRAKDEGAEKAKDRQKSKGKNKYICKLPIIVVRSKRTPECTHGSSTKTRFRCCLVKEELRTKMPPKDSNTSSASPMVVPGCPSSQSLSTKRANLAEKQEVLKSAECEELPEIANELGALTKKLERQIQMEIDQKRILNTMNDRLKQLCENIKTLNETTNQIKCGKENPAKSPTKQTSTCLESPIDEGNAPLERTHSSRCEFCKDSDLPVISTMQYPLFKMIGKRSFGDIALSILLRADNVYHVNVRDLETGTVLGCLLVSDAGIREANSLGLFKEILTFCVIDERSTISGKDSVFGNINFEFIRKQRLTGGDMLSDNSQQNLCHEKAHSHQYEAEFYQADVRGSVESDQDADCQSKIFEEVQPKLQFHSTKPNNIVKSGHSVSKTLTVMKSNPGSTCKPKMSLSEVIREINSYSSSIVLADTETKYPVRKLRITSLMDYSSASEFEDDDSSTTTK
ncbi:uncharacterized protein LOC111596072 [Drosophila hydei]|uniref:Uncharacterized protein LOC111596072 n=1 Tax=Drosophila hydei TaxID=7224 RepID=A0A6J1LJD6_DROHY|nr:uncharacterized protein LOC111596072 [Drosophila hydei]